MQLDELYKNVQKPVDVVQKWSAGYVKFGIYGQKVGFELITYRYSTQTGTNWCPTNVLLFWDVLGC